jgi:hypothetical protein
LAQIPDNPFGCPSIRVAFGFFYVNHTTLKKVTAAICYQNLQEVETEATYFGDLASGLVSETRPPKPNESTIKLLTNGTQDFTAFPYRPQAKFASSIENPLLVAQTTPEVLEPVIRAMATS